MCARCIVRKPARLHGIVMRNQCELDEDGSHQTIATTLDPKKNLEACRNDGRTQPIYI
jgi:hypothetical protein